MAVDRWMNWEEGVFDLESTWRDHDLVDPEREPHTDASAVAGSGVHGQPSALVGCVTMLGYKEVASG